MPLFYIRALLRELRYADGLRCLALRAVVFARHVTAITDTVATAAMQKHYAALLISMRRLMMPPRQPRHHADYFRAADI